MDLDSVSVHKHAKKELGQYPAILTSHLVNNPYLFSKYRVFSNIAQFITCDTKKVTKPSQNTGSVASSRHSVSWGAARKIARKKYKKSVVRGSERTAVGKLNKKYTRIWYTL